MRIYIQTGQLFGVFCEVLLNLGFTSFTKSSVLVLRSKVSENLEKINATVDEFDKEQYEYYYLRSKEFYRTKNKITIKPEYRKRGYFREKYFCLGDSYYNNIYDTIRQTIEKDGLYLDSDRRLTVEKQKTRWIQTEQALTLAFLSTKTYTLNYNNWKTACYISDLVLSNRYDIKLAHDRISMEDLFLDFEEYFEYNNRYSGGTSIDLKPNADLSKLKSDLLNIPEDALETMKVIFNFYLKDPITDKHLDDIDRICQSMREETEKLKELRKTDKEIAKVIANYNLQQAGILDEYGELTEPYK